MTREQIEHAIKCCNPYGENCGDCPFHDLPLGRCFEVLAKTAFNMLLDDRERLQKQVDEYKAKIEQGTLIELPCNVGDTIYIPWDWDGCSGVSFHEIVKIAIYPENVLIVFEVDTDVAALKYGYYSDGVINISSLGRRFFLTREEAEARLKELQGNSDADDNI